MPIYDTNRIANTTAQKWLNSPAEINNTMRKSLYLSLLRKRGRIKTGQTGKYLVQTLRFADGNATTRADGSPVVYDAVDRWRQLEIPQRHILAPDSITEGEKLKNSGAEAIIKIVGGMSERLKGDVEVAMRTQLYTDGNAGDQTNFHGFDSFTGTGTTAAGDIVAQPSDTYMGHATNVGYIAGTWSAEKTTKPNAAIATDWPEGSGSASYDWLAPKLINWSSNAWPGGLTTWAANCEYSLRYGKTVCDTVAAGVGKLDLATMDVGMLNGFKNKESAKQQIWAPYKEAEDLGFPESILFEGMMLSSEFGCPANSVYGHNLETEWFGVWGSEFYRAIGPTYDPGRVADVFSVSVWGNMVYNPRNVFKIKNYA
jgi:hypothetical protein